jgi:Holliday junction DNA helicase RuvA
MIARLKGELVSRSDEDIVVDVNGVGYLVSSTTSVLSNLPALGGAITVLIYTDVKESSISLFGFATQLEREVFLLLKKVSGIGSKTALGLISGVGAEGLLQAIGRGESAPLTRVSGVGKKTAERVILELREKVGELAVIKPAEGVRAAELSGSSWTTGVAGPAGDALLALEKLGFNPERARSAVEAATKSSPDLIESGEILRAALSQL